MSQVLSTTADIGVPAEGPKQHVFGDGTTSVAEHPLSGRQKMLAAIGQEGSPAVPVVLPYLGIFVRDHWDSLTSLPWWTPYDDSDFDVQVELYHNILDEVDIDWVSVGLGRSRRHREAHRLETQGEQVFSVNVETGARTEVRRPPPGGFKCWSKRPAQFPSNSEDIEALIPLNGGNPLEDGSTDFPMAIVKEFGDRRVICGDAYSPLWRCNSLVGFDALMLAVSRHGDTLHRILERMTERALLTIRAEAAAGIDVLWIEECMTDMISPSAWREFNLPYLKRIVDWIRECGLRSIYYYCGNPHDRLESLLEVGADCLALEESKKGFHIDIEDIASKLGPPTCLFGNVDAITLMERGTDEQLRRELKRQVEAGSNHGRFIMSLGSPVTALTPVSRVRDYVDWSREVAAT